MAYATVDDLAAAMTPRTPPANAAQLLTRASRQVDRNLLTAVYDATDPDVITALKEATCEQVIYQLGIGNSAGIESGYQQVSILSVSLSKAQPAGGSNGDSRFSPEAFTILQLAGLTGQDPSTP